MSTEVMFNVACRLADEAEAHYRRGEVEDGDEKLNQAKEIRRKYFLTETITSDTTKG